MKKKITSLLLTFTLCLGLLPAALAADGGETLTAGEAESRYGISISPSSIDLGTIYNTPAKEERTFTVTNNGDVDVAVAKSGGTGILSSGNRDSDAYLIKAGESRDYTFSINTYTPQKGSDTIDLLVIIEPEKVGSWKTSFYYESYTTGERCTIKDALTVHYDLRALSDADAGDIAWELSDTFIDFGTSDVADGHHPSQEKALTVTNRGSLPFVFEAVFDLSACERANKKDLFYKGISGAGSFVRPGESTKIRVSTASGYQIPGKVEGCVLKLTAYYRDSKEKNTLTAEIPLSIKYLTDGSYRIRNLSDNSFGTVKTSDGINRDPYSDNSLFLAKEGSSVTFVMTPYDPAAYHVSDIKINDESVGTHGMVGNTYTISNVQASMEFEAVFAPGADPNAKQPQPTEQPTGGTAYASTQNVLVDGSAVEFQCYALKDEKGNDTNYVKLRDVAQVLSGTAVQFQVGWDGAVNIETGKPYTSIGSEMKTPFSGDRAYEAATAPTNVNGQTAALEAIVLKDDSGGAYTYYKLRDLGTALNFKVNWSVEKGIFIETR